MEVWVDSCLVCGKRFFSELEMSQHVKQIHGSCIDDNTVSPASFSLKDCPLCPFQHENIDEIREHLQYSHSQELKTPEKKKNIPTSSENSAINGTLGENSDVCSKSIHSYDKEDVDDNVVACPVCGLTNFDSSELLNAHVDLHFKNDAPTFSGQDTADEKIYSQYMHDELLAKRLQQQENYTCDNKSKETAENLYFQQLQEQHGMGEKYSKTGFRKQAFQVLENGVGRGALSTFDYYSKKLDMLEKLEEGVDDGMTVTSGLIEYLKNYFDQESNSTHRVWLCTSMDHIGRGPGDSGWGCGYRNIQMILSHLNNNCEYKEELKQKLNGKLPSIPKLQEMIEQAWSEGYDVRGAEQLELKLVGTRKWIGATEAFTLLASLNLHCRIIDFPRYSVPGASHQPLLTWILNYFRDSKPESEIKKVNISVKPPLYLQHEGHSRTVVGIICETDRTQNLKCNETTFRPVKFIQFDPGNTKTELRKKVYSKKKSSNKNQAHSNTPAIHQLIKPISNLNKSQYQIVCVQGIATTDRVLQQKNVDSVCEKVH